MPRYAWFAKNEINFESIPRRMNALQTVGVPYTDEEISKGAESAKAQAQLIADDLKSSGVKDIDNKEMLAIIAYMQRLGSDIGWRQ
jgi:cytochrome c oxidase cbb3-type subunit I/II